jgi:hypothetical protein
MTLSKQLERAVCGTTALVDNTDKPRIRDVSTCDKYNIFDIVVEVLAFICTTRSAIAVYARDRV